MTFACMKRNEVERIPYPCSLPSSQSYLFRKIIDFGPFFFRRPTGGLAGNTHLNELSIWTWIQDEFESWRFVSIGKPDSSQNVTTRNKDGELISEPAVTRLRCRVDIRHPLLYIQCLWHDRARTGQLVIRASSQAFWVGSGRFLFESGRFFCPNQDVSGLI